ncbi:mechanosensitive ion channel family protein [Corynebacterium sp. HS2168-gen11]|uniref:mechanosensitive ion channel family protein n=1 Tax=Corynebacterium sp. HS2168-gen11 TaxID=2974027 RepID=UPI00216AC574|nr:mechanosensitive ion channel family protein [Corynebacterium sp. HS2168-gen11]MCS4534828.1 mechanosensitive ion channel family protein [Corynebacterium sp. HS2168-gen11]
MPLSYIALQIWTWIATTGSTLGIIIIAAFLIPRAGRLAMYIIANKLITDTQDQHKTQLALTGAAVYIVQILAYFLVFVLFLQAIGFSLAGAAIPATAASAAIGLGAQSIIADFLAGFFILSEKQYGVGDWVRFEGGATVVEGTVIQITMRSTRIRTLAEETVIIPNSKAGVAINNSNHWSSALVTMPIPLHSSHSIHQAIERASTAANRALYSPDIRPVVLGPLTVHEAVEIREPATVGLPWTVDMRFLAQVTPGAQWKVERAMRVRIIEEFWQEYGSASTPDGRSIAIQSLEGHEPTELPDTDALAVDADALAGADVTDQTERGLLDSDDPAIPNTTAETLIPVKPQGWERLFSIGGRTRISTTILIASLCALTLLKAVSLDTSAEYSNGILAPTTLQESSSTQTP